MGKHSFIKAENVKPSCVLAPCPGSGNCPSLCQRNLKCARLFSSRHPDEQKLPIDGRPSRHGIKAMFPPWRTTEAMFSPPQSQAGKMRACKFGRVLRPFWDWGPMDHKNVSIFSYLLHWARGWNLWPSHSGAILMYTGWPVPWICMLLGTVVAKR